MNDLKAEFERHETDGYLGNPAGSDAYAYLRASSERQVEQGSSFTRQLENIHIAAKRDNLRIPFELIFFDDGFTGFEFEHRPALLKLRHEVVTKPRAYHLVIEDIDRLSRNADWQQGFLLEEFSRHNIEVHFYIHPGSQLERYVRGYIAQEGMLKDRERMRMGTIYKAMSGKVTAKRPRYGYIKTHPQDSYYELHPYESKIMRLMYELIIYKRWSLQQIATWLNDNNIPCRFAHSVWAPSTVYGLLKSSVYKGVFYANRHYGVRSGFREDGRPKQVMRERPKEEWIEVTVPAIVTPEEWEQAQAILAQNARKSLRNAKKNHWLLVGFLKCGICKEYSMNAREGSSPKSRKRYYSCQSNHSEKARILGTYCESPYVRADLLERRVWEEVEKVIYNPELILARLEERQQNEVVSDIQEQLDFVDRQIQSILKERSKFEAAYQRDIYTLDEFEEKMKDLRGRLQALELSRAKIEAKMHEIHSLEEQREVVIKALARVRTEIESAKADGRQPQEIPFDLKRKILSLLVKVIWVDSIARTFTIEGEIKGVYSLDEEPDDPPSSNTPGGGNSDFGFTSTPKSL